MIIKSYEIQRKKSDILKCNFFLLYGENIGLKKDIRKVVLSTIKGQDKNIENISLYENEILDNKENFFDSVYSGSLFSTKKIITIYQETEKINKIINEIYEKKPENIFIIICSNILEKKSKLRLFFEIEKETLCIPCYLDNTKDLEIILQAELKKNNIKLSQESRNLLVEKSNFDRNNLRNELEKIKAYSLNKKNLDFEEVKFLINFSGEYKSDSLVNECLCGNLTQYRKILSEMYLNTVNQILLLRILGNKIQRLLKIKEQLNNSNNIDNLINSSRPPIFWKEKPIIKKQLSIWNLEDLFEIIDQINNTELLCKKNPQVSNTIFFKFFSEICVKANNVS